MKRIESTQNALVKHWKKLVLNRKDRDKASEFIVEGFHLVEEAIKNKNVLLTVMKREDVTLPKEWNLENIVVIEITKAVAKEIEETEQSQGIFGHCRQQVMTNKSFPTWEKILLIDAVQDPGNLGTIIRTADAAGIEGIVIGTGTVDPYNPKVVRSGQGSHFNIPIVRGNLADWIKDAKENDVQIIGTSLDDSIHYKEANPSGKFALIVGNEGKGVNEDLLAETDINVRIPIYGKAESLNVAVATGILLYMYVK